ncbi:hypothetical protein AB3K92_18760 [Burkholderia sp. Bmkn7]|uniref:hypothetical protein n=1 Tax=Burkholderia sp. Bmkn7 TaxID=3236841 RepID=UPI0034E5F505
MDQAVRAGQRDADSSSAVQGRFDRAWPMPAPAGLDRTPVGRIIRKTFRRQLRETTCHLAAMQARCRLNKRCVFNVAAFAVVNVFANFRFRHGVPRTGTPTGGVSNIAGRKDICIFLVCQAMVFLINPMFIKIIENTYQKNLDNQKTRD